MLVWHRPRLIFMLATGILCGRKVILRPSAGPPTFKTFATTEGQGSLAGCSFETRVVDTFSTLAVAMEGMYNVGMQVLVTWK